MIFNPRLNHRKIRMVHEVLGYGHTQLSHTGDTNVTTLATVVVPANAMGPNGIIRVNSTWTVSPTSANNKTVRVRFGGGLIVGPVLTTNTLTSQTRWIANRNATNSQVSSFNPGDNSYGVNAGTFVTLAIDTTAAVNIIFTAELATAGEQINLETYYVELLREEWT